MAFAIYYAPPDFSQGNDAYTNSATRTVNFQATAPGVSSSGAVTILRPPVVLVHGIWDSKDGWKSFPLDQTLFSLFPAQYDVAITVAKGSPNANPNDTTTTWTPFALKSASANQLSFTYNAPGVHDQIKKFIVSFRGGKNVLQTNAAAAQADVVAHSLGGLVTRQISLLPEYLDQPSFGVGNVHKLITIGTPHFGSPLATALLQDPNAECMLASQHSLVFGSWVGAPGAQSIGAGAVYDMQGETSLSQALSTLNGSNPHALPVSAIAGQISGANDLHLSLLNWNSWLTNIQNTIPLIAATFRLVGFGCGPCSIEVALAANNWFSLFNGNANDGMVSVGSQLHGAGSGWPGLIHTIRLVDLGFTGPGELQDPVNIPNNVVNLLNQPVNGSKFTRF